TSRSTIPPSRPVRTTSQCRPGWRRGPCGKLCVSRSVAHRQRIWPADSGDICDSSCWRRRLVVGSRATPAMVARDAERCIACGSERLRFVDGAAIDALAEAWANEQRLRSGAGHTAATWRQTMESVIDAPVVRFDRCEQCGSEVASPRRTWIEGTYPDYERYPPRWEFYRFFDDLGGTPASLLELGSGIGTFLSLARERGHRPTGID